MEKNEPKKSMKITAAFLIFAMCFNILPAQEIASSIHNSEVQLEYYLDRAMQERQNEKWESLVSEGLLAAMSIWENENIEALDSDAYESEKQKAEEYLEDKVNKKYTQWSLEKERDRINMQASVLEQKLRAAALAFEYEDENGNKTRIVNIDSSEDARAQWNDIAEKIIAEFTAQMESETAIMISDIANRNKNINLSDEETKKLVDEFVESQKKLISEKYLELSQKEENSLMNDVLYDHESLRKASDKEAAAVIASQLAKETETNTDREMKELFDEFQEEIIRGELANFDLQNSDWFDKFEDALNQSLEAWNNAELKFLQARSEWELNAKEVFISNEEVWQAAFKELDDRKNQWNDKIYKEIADLQQTLKDQRADLESEIQKDLLTYYAMLENQKTSNKKIIMMQESIYNESRSLMAMSQEGIGNWFDHWGEKYNGLYSYWKTEDAATFKLYFGNTTQLENKDLKINTTYTVDSDNNKIYSESESITNLKNQINNWNKAYLAMTIREISKTISSYNSIISSNTSSIKSYQDIIDKFESLDYNDIKNGENLTSPSNAEQGRQREAYLFYNEHKGSIDSYRGKVAYLTQENIAYRNKIESLKSLKVTFENTDATDTDVLRSRLSQLKSFKEIRGVTDSIFTGAYKALWNTEDFILGTGSDLTYWATQLEKNTRQTEEAAVELYKKAGYTLTDSGMNELENQYLKTSALEQYWKEQLEIATAVKEYAVNRTSAQEVLSETEANLVAAINAYNAANTEYLATLETLDSVAKTVDGASAQIDAENEKLASLEKVLEDKQKEYYAALDAYNGLYGSAVEKSINQIIDLLNAEQSSDANKKSQLDEYYTLLAKQVSITAEQNRQTILKGLTDGIYSPAITEKSMDNFSATELNMYAGLKTSAVLADNFDVTLLNNISSICDSEVKSIVQALQLYSSDTTSDADKEVLKVYIEANVLNINKAFNREKQKRELSKDFLNGQNIDSNVVTVSPMDMTAAFMDIYFELYVKAGVEKDLSEETKASLDAVKEKYSKMSKEDFNAYLKENRDEPIIIAILNLASFSPEYTCLFNSKYNEKLFALGYESASIVDQVKTGCSEYLISNINEANSKAMTEVGNIIKNNNTASMNKDQLLNYIVELNMAADGLDDASVSALNLYISELLYNFTYENDVSVDMNSVNQKALDTTAKLNEISKWTNYVQSASYIGEILKSDIFTSLDANSSVRKQIVSQAAYLYLPYIKDLSSKEKIAGDKLFEGVSDSIKTSIAEEIEALTKIYPVYEYKSTDEDYEKLDKLYDLTETYFAKEATIAEIEIEIEVLNNVLLSKNPDSDRQKSKEEQEQIENLRKKIAELRESIVEVKTIFDEYVNSDEYLISVFDQIDFNLTDKDYYLPSIIGRDFLYELLCAGVVNESGNIVADGIDKIDEVNAYLGENKFEDLAHLSETIKYIWSYNELFDGNAFDWIDSLEISDDFKTELKDYYQYGKLVFPEYYNAHMQMSYNNGGDRYYKDVASNQTELFASISDLYTSNFKEYVKAGVETELNSYIVKKTEESLANESTWLSNKNSEIDRNNAGLPSDKKVQKLSIGLEDIQSEKNYTFAFEKYFTEPQDKYQLTSNVNIAENLKSDITEAYINIYSERNERKNNIAVLKNEFALLEQMFDDSIVKQQQLNAALKAYQIAEENTNAQKQSYYDAIDTYKEKCEDYNAQMAVVQSKYNTLETKRIEKRKADEIKRWADNEYLHDFKGTYNSVAYETPEEMFDRVNEAYTKAKAANDYVAGIKNSKKSTVEAKYEKEFNEYTTAYEKYFRAVLLKSEFSAAVAKQEAALKEAEEKVEKARIELIKSCTNKVDLSDAAKKYVVATKVSDGKYKFDIAGYADISTSQLETYYNDEKSYLYTDENENDVYVDLAQADAFSWLLEMEAKGGDELEDLILAAFYLYYQDDSVKEAIKNVEEIAKNDPNAAGVIVELHGMDSRSIFDNAVTEEIKAAYNKIIGNAEKRENLAKLFLFKDTYLVEENEQLFFRANNVLCRRAYESVKDEANSKEIEYIGLSVAMAAVAAGFYACVTIFTPWFLVPAIAATVAAASLAGTAHDFASYKNELTTQQSAANNNIAAKEKKMNSLINDYKDAEAKRVAERDKLNIMKFGSSTGTLDALDYDAFEKSLAEAIKTSELKNDDGTALLSISYLSEIYDINDKNHNSLKSYYDVVNKDGKEYTSVAQVLSKITGNLSAVQLDKEIALNNKAAALKAEQKNAAVDYNNALLDNISKAKEYTSEQLEAKANAAFGNDSWNEIAYQNRLQEFYSQFTDHKYISNKRGTESYIQDAISKLKISYALELEEEEALCYDARQYKDTLVMQNYFNEEAQIKQQIDQILYVADKEWIEAEKKLNASHNTWLNDFDSQLDSKRNAWTTNYANFLTEKSNYITTQYVYAQNVGNINSLVDSGIDVEKVLAESLSGLENMNVENEVLNQLKNDMNGYISTLYNEDLLTNLYNMSALASNSAKSYGARLFSGQEKNIGTIDSYLAALKVQDEIAKDMKDNAARLAAEQAETQITKMIEAFMNRIDLENNAMRDWEETLVRNYGYEFGSTIKREAIVDASFCNTIRDTQYVHLYQNFATATPSVPFSVNAGDSNIVVMSKIRNAQNALAEWSERIFGRTDVDENGNQTIKYFYVPRSIADLNNVSEYEKNTIKQEDIGDRTDIVSIRDGEFGEYLGYAPEWNSEVDVSKGREANLKSKEIHGEIGLIMLDFQWNEMERSYGMARFQLPAYDKPLWPAGGFFEPPTLRSLTALACDIAGIITEQSWWLGIVDDVLFGAMDLAIEKKDPGQVAVGFAKAVVINELSAGLGTLGGSLIESASAISNTGLRITTKALIGAGTAYTTSAAGGFINAIQYDTENGWGYDLDSAIENLYSASTIGASVTGGVTAGLNAYYNADGTGITLNKNTFNTKAIKSLTSLAGGFAGNITSLLMGGDATFNLLSIVGSNGNLSGMLEFSFGANGVHARFGTGGTNISISNLKNVAAGVREAKKVNEWKTGSMESWAKLNEANLAAYSSNIDNNLLSLAIWNEDVNVVFSDALTDAYGNAVNGYYDPDTNSIVIDSGFLGDSRDDMAKLAAIFGHEGAHMAGHDNEAEAHQSGFNAYAEAAKILGIDGDIDFAKAMIVEALRNSNNEANDEGRQFWKLVANSNGSYDWMWDDDLNFNLGNLSKNELDAMFLSDLWKTIKVGKNGMYIEYSDMDRQTAKLLGYQLASAGFGHYGPNMNMVNKKEYFSPGYETNDGRSRIEKIRERTINEFADATVKFAEASTSAADFMDYIAKKSSSISEKTAQAKLKDLNKKLDAVTKSGHLARSTVEKAKSDRVLTANGNSFPMALNAGQDYFNMTTGYGYSYLEYLGDSYLRTHLQDDFTNQNGGKYSNPLIASKEQLTYGMDYNNTFGLFYIVQDENGKYQRLGHMAPDSVMDYIGLIMGSGTSFDGSQVSGVGQNSIVGQTGTTGKSSGIHLDLTQYSNGYSVNPETIWAALFEDGSIKDIAGTRWGNDITNGKWDVEKARFVEEVMNFAYGINTAYDPYDSIWYDYGLMQDKNFDRLMQKYGDILPFDLLQSYNAELKSKLEQEWLETYQNQILAYRLMQNSIFTMYTPEQQAKLNGLTTFYDIYFQGGSW